MNRITLALGAVLLTALPFLLHAQDKNQPRVVSGKPTASRTIKGRIADDKGTPLDQAVVQAKGTGRKTLTKADGTFSLEVPDTTSVLMVSHVSMSYQEVQVGGQSSVDVKMKPLSADLNDVIVVGYGTKKKGNVLGAIATIKAEDVEDLPVANLGTALVGRVPGLGVSVASGKPGATTTVSIRNPTLFAASGQLGLTADPLYVIDGINMTKTDFDNLDASLIETLTFLKDASAAIYGAAGAKGVVLVTTKRGRPGKAVINYSGYFGSSTSSVKPKVMSAYEHAKMLNDGYDANNDQDSKKFSQADLNFLKTNPYKSWYDELWKSASLTRHTVNVSGGSEKVTFFAGANYYNEGGNYGDISIKKYGIRTGMNAKISENLSANISVNTDYSKQYRNTLKGASDETDDYTIRALFTTPQWVPLTINGLPNNWSGPNPPGAWNPVALFNSDNYKTSKSQGLSLNATLEYKVPFIKGLAARVQFGKVDRTGTSKEYYPSYLVYNFTRSGQNGLLYTNTPTSSPTSKVTNSDLLTQGTNFTNSYQLIGTLTYARKIGKHEFDALVALDQSESNGDDYLTYRTGQQIPNIDQFFAFNAATTTVQLNGTSETGKRSFLGRLNYTFNNRYLLEFVGRYDGSVNFPPSSRWGLFPAVGLGWKISEEDFFKELFPFINSFKLRVNGGKIGDDRVTSYQYKARFTQTTGMLFGTTVTNGLDPSIYPNPNITWEKSRTFNYGFDGAVLNNRLTFSADFWTRKTYDGFDIFSTSGLPYTVGITTGISNYGIQNNWGTEFNIGFKDVINKDWGYNVQLNFGTSGNQLVQTYYNPALLGTPTEYTILIGKNSNTFNSSNYGYISKGILRTQADVDALLSKNPNYKIGGAKPQVGFMNFEDVNNDGQINDNDIVPMFSRTASTVGMGLTLGISYKTFRLNTNMTLAIGGKKFVDAEARKVPTTTTNAPSFWADHWTPDNPNAKYPRADAPLAKENSTFWAVSGTAGRINNMTLSYTLPRQLSDKWRIPTLRVLLTGTNLWQVANPYKYKDINTGNFAAYPTLRSISVGVSASL